MSYREEVASFLKIRRGLGFKLENHEFQLRSFVKHLEEIDADHITTDIALEWATEDGGGRHPATNAQRLSTVRQFARHMVGVDPRTEVPPKGLLPARFPRVRPYIYTSEETRKLMKAALDLAPSSRLRGHSYSTIIGLLASTGMRLAEGLALQIGDVDLETGLLEIRESKCRRSRIVPIESSTVSALQAYRELKSQHYPAPPISQFFVDDGARAIPHWKLRYHFVRLCVQAGLRETVSSGPRLHEFRHTFAVKTLINWYESGVDVDQRMPQLSTYLGHVHIADTYWYISAHPELLRLAGSRLEKTIGGLI